MGARRLCWLLAACAAVWGALAEEEEATSLDIGISVTLLGSVTFVMLLMYAIHTYDADVRQHTYSAIVSTISIFCAVLIFSTCNDLLEHYVLSCFGGEDGENYKTCMIRLFHMLLWYVWMQTYLAFVCKVWGKQIRDWDVRSWGKLRRLGELVFGTETEYEKENGHKLNVKCWATLLAHLAGFASINAWGSLQQLPFFKSTPAMTLLVLPIAIVGGLVLQRCTHYVRMKVTMMDDEVSEEEKMWSEEAEECEDDVVGLTLSFNAVQSIRYFVTSQLPNLEGAWEEHDMNQILKNNPWMTLGWIYLVGITSAAAVVVLVKRRGVQVDAEARNEVEKGPDSESEGHGHSDDESDTRDTFKKIKKRFWHKVVTTLSMGHAWCSFYSGKLMLALLMQHAAPGFRRVMSLALALSFLLTAAAYIAIRILDYFFDKAKSQNDKHAELAVAQISLSVGLMVGFSWEQCFDEAIESIGSWCHPHVQLAKALLAAWCVGVLVPAYRRFFLPMQVLKGYMYGFVVQRLGDRGTEELCQATEAVAETLTKRFNQFQKMQDREADDEREEREALEKAHLTNLETSSRKKDDCAELEKALECVTSLQNAILRQIAIKKRSPEALESVTSLQVAEGVWSLRSPEVLKKVIQGQLIKRCPRVYKPPDPAAE